MQFSEKMLNSYIAPYISQLANPAIPDIPLPSDQRLVFGLNHELGGVKFKHGAHTAALMSAMSRHIVATREYLAARKNVQDYVAVLPEHNAVGNVMSAISNFESCILHAYIATLCLQHIHFAFKGQDIFQKNDGGPHDRLRQISNRIKHYDEDLDKALKSAAAFDTYPIWLTDNAICCAMASITYVELADLLKEQGEDLTYMASDFFKDAATK